MVIYLLRVIPNRLSMLGCLLLVYSSLGYAASSYGLLPSQQYKLGSLGFQSKWQSQWLQEKASYLGGYRDVSYSYNLSSSAHFLRDFSAIPRDFGITAVLRYQRTDGSGFYAEAGTGPQYQFFSYDLLGRPENGRFAMNTLAGVGFIWKNGVDLGFKAIHVSRSQGVDGSDPGNMVGIGVTYRW